MLTNRCNKPLSALLAERRDDIVREWETFVRQTPAVTHAVRDVLREQIPQLLDEIARIADQLDRGDVATHGDDRTSGPQLPTTPRSAPHPDRAAAARAIDELSILRETIIGVSDAEPSYQAGILERAVDQAIGRMIAQLMNDQEQMLAPPRLMARATPFEPDLSFRELADHLPQPVWIADAGGVMVWCNARWAELTGLLPMDRGTQLRSVSWHDLLHPDDQARVREGFSAAIARGADWADTLWIRRTDGRYVCLFTRARPVRDGRGAIWRWVITATDVTCEQILTRATTLLGGCLEDPDTLRRVVALIVPELADWCVVDADTGGDSRDFIAMTVAHTHPGMQPVLEAVSRRLRATRCVASVIATNTPCAGDDLEQVFAEMDESLRDEDRRSLRELGTTSYVIAPLAARGQTLGTIVLGMNQPRPGLGLAERQLVTELGRAFGIAIANGRLLARARAATQEATEEIRMRDEVMALISHDLRNPLGAIDLSVSMLIDRDGLDDRARRHVEIIRRSTGRLTRMVTDLADMAAIDAGELKLMRRPVAVRVIVEQAIAGHQTLIRERQVQLREELHLGDAIVECDHERMALVFANLIGQRLKVARPGDCITVRGCLEQRLARFELTDTCPALSPDERAHIFQPFWARRHGKQVKTAVGLELYNARGIIAAHGGCLELTSSPDQGTTFAFTLPTIEAQSPS